MGKIQNLAERISKSKIWYKKGDPISESVQHFAEPAWQFLIYFTILSAGYAAAYKGIKYLINNF